MATGVQHAAGTPTGNSGNEVWAVPATLPRSGRLEYRPGLCQHLRSTPVPRNDLQLIQACLAGRHDAWDELVDRFKRLVYSIPRRYGFSDADADDVFQNVFIILYRKLDTVRDHERLAGWLIRTTHRESTGLASSPAGMFSWMR